MTDTAPVEEKPPKVTLTAPPDPLPVNWHRAIANSIATELRHGWRKHKATRAIGNTRSRDYHTPGQIPTIEPTTELLYNTPYTEALVVEEPALGIPYLAWELTQLDLAQALNNRGIMHYAKATQTWLGTRPKTGPPPTAFIAKPNRHGQVMLRRNSAYLPESVAQVFDVAATTATIWVPDRDDLLDFLAYYDGMKPESLMVALRG